MALDPQMSGLLAALNARDLPDMSCITDAEFRAASNDKRMARTLEPMHSIEDQQIPARPPRSRCASIVRKRTGHCPC